MGRSLARSTVSGRLPGVTFAEAKEKLHGGWESPQPVRPLLMIDIDGVLSLFGMPAPGAPMRAHADSAPEGGFHWIDGIPHFLSATAAAHLHALAPLFDLVWASGWEEKAEEYLPHRLGVPAGLPYLRFGGDARRRRTANAHWKLDAIDAHAAGRPLAWIDDSFNDACEDWAAARDAPTLLVQTAPERGLTSREEHLLAEWATALAAS
jgi:hypothetical protein